MGSLRTYGLPPRGLPTKMDGFCPEVVRPIAPEIYPTQNSEVGGLSKLYECSVGHSANRIPATPGEIGRKLREIGPLKDLTYLKYTLYIGMYFSTPYTRNKTVHPIYGMYFATPGARRHVATKKEMLCNSPIWAALL